MELGDPIREIDVPAPVEQPIEIPMPEEVPDEVEVPA